MQKRPNILLITTDQQHANTIHALGNSVIQTPNLDALAGRGISFGRTYVTNPVCSPSRSSILTGEYPSRHGCWNIGVKLDEGRPRVSDVLCENGYRTALFGKTHFQPVLAEGSFEAPPHVFDRDFWRNWSGPYYGFQEVKMLHGHSDEISSSGMHYGAWLEDQGVDIQHFFGPGGGYREGKWDLPEELHYTRWTANQTIEFLERNNSDNPFFIWCSFQDPHNAFLVPEPWDSLYNEETLPEFVRQDGEIDGKPLLYQYLIQDKLDEMDVAITSDPNHPTKGIQCLGPTTDRIGEARAKRWLSAYYGMISLIDYHVGRVLETLDRLDLTRDTLVIFTSDHGDYAGNHGLWLKGPLHYEDVIRVPFIVSWPEQIPENVQSDSLQSLVDLAPTLYEICGVDTAPFVQGVSQFHTWAHPDQAVRDYCLVENRAEPTFYVKTIVGERYKLNYFLGRNEGELYDLKEDPNEFVNLFSDPNYAGIVLEMLQLMVDMHGQIEGPYPERQSFA